MQKDNADNSLGQHGKHVKILFRGNQKIREDRRWSHNQGSERTEPRCVLDQIRGVSTCSRFPLRQTC
ncbi:hypothetical protein B9Z55_028160 [Caenorhabditis nigoni]|uniref:Uncharacterized protein n=1 Tax=Caenorhabditis nigoni TaxID=1611254 RepID=A0A2G5SCY4_9PELO|nr:hypothetical protein B9Z55_028160 [Caenorhabditis nigoni]